MIWVLIQHKKHLEVKIEKYRKISIKIDKKSIKNHLEVKNR
jgi:hypothetical protein